MKTDEIEIKPELQAVIDHLLPPPGMSNPDKWRADLEHFVKAFGDKWWHWMVEHYGTNLVGPGITRLAARVAQLTPFEPKLDYMDVRPGKMEVSISFAKHLLLIMVDSFAKMNEKANNYTESEVVMQSSGRRFTVTVRNKDGKTPHELRVAAEVEVARLTAWVADLQSGMYVNCVYCGHRYGPKETTPVAMADALKEHIEQCDQHPMSVLKRENEEYKARLAKLEKGIAAPIDPEKRKAILKIAKGLAIELAIKHPQHHCNSDDVFAELRRLGCDTRELGNAVVGCFKGKNWKNTGTHKKSTRGNNHARALMVWEYIGPMHEVFKAKSEASCNSN